jgi:hypothetical protein
MKIEIVFSVLFFCFCLFESYGQEQWQYGRWKSIGYSYEINASISVDTITFDTIIESVKEGYRKIISTEGFVLAYGELWGGMGTDCGCVVQPHGHWVNRNRDNTIKEFGEYYCNHQIGTWYFFERDSLARIETYSKAYPNYIKERNTKTFLNGPYLEFYTNGNLKVEGYYKIIEEYSTTDTIFIFNPETYLDENEILEGEFWLPKSIKFGIWKIYDVSGNLVDKKAWDVDYMSHKIRFPELRVLGDADH